jgi:hypothetical protein
LTNFIDILTVIPVHLALTDTITMSSDEGALSVTAEALNINLTKINVTWITDFEIDLQNHWCSRLMSQGIEAELDGSNLRGESNLDADPFLAEMIALYNSGCILVSTSLLAVATSSILSTSATAAKVAVSRHSEAALANRRGK